MRIVISGGSVGGLFAAALLAQDGHEVRIFERSKSGLAGRGAGLVAQQEVYDVLKRMGRPEIADTGVIAKARIILDAHGNTLQTLSHPQTQMSWDRLYLTMLGLVDPAAYRLGASVVAAGSDERQAWVELSDGTRESADLVIGADGIGSSVRAAFEENQADVPLYAGYVAWRFLIPEQHLSTLAASSLTDRFAFFHGEKTQVLGYLVAGPAGETEPGLRRYNCVWYRQVSDLPALLTGRDGRRPPFSLPPGSVPGPLHAALLDDARRTLPLPFIHVMAADPTPFVQAIFDMTSTTLVSRRMLLLGDAAFVARPHTAMGVAKAAGDAMLLADLLRSRDLDDALNAYNATRLRIGRSIVAYGRRLGADLSPGDPTASF